MRNVFYPLLGIFANRSRQLFWIVKSENEEVLGLPLEGHDECIVMRNEFLELSLKIKDTSTHLETSFHFTTGLYYIGKDSPNGRFRIKESLSQNTSFHMYDVLNIMFHGRHVFYSQESLCTRYYNIGLEKVTELEKQKAKEKFWNKKVWSRQTCLPDGHGTIQSSNYHELLYNKELDIFKVVDFRPSDFIKGLKHFYSANARIDENGHFDYITPEGKSEPKDEPGFESCPFVECPTAKDALKTHPEGWKQITEMFTPSVVEYIKKNMSSYIDQRSSQLDRKRL